MRHVFISYVRENEVAVDKLCKALRSEAVEVWLDRDAISPGELWRDAIRRAIKTGAFFIACFSAEFADKAKTYMNDELTTAIDELRQRPYDRSWFIPVLLSDCEIPEREIGGGQTLRDIQWVSLFDDWDNGIDKILNVVAPNRCLSKEGSRHAIELRRSEEGLAEAESIKPTELPNISRAGFSTSTEITASPLSTGFEMRSTEESMIAHAPPRKNHRFPWVQARSWAVAAATAVIGIVILWVPLSLIDDVNGTATREPVSYIFVETIGYQVVINASNPFTKLDTKTIANMFLKKTARWTDGTAVVPIDREQFSEVRKAFSKAILGRSAWSVENYWQRMIFSDRDSPPRKAANDQEVLILIAAEAGGIGYVDSATELIEGVKTLKISKTLTGRQQ